MDDAPITKKQYSFKVLVIGDPGTGKTSIIRRLVHNAFTSNYKATIGVDFALKIMAVDPTRLVHLQLWDISGQDRYGVMTRVYYKDAHAAVVVCDATRERTVEGAMRWKADLDQKVTLADGSPVPAILVANKCDMDNALKEDQLHNLEVENGFIGAYRTSAKENIGVEEAFLRLVEQILSTESNGDYEIPLLNRDGNVRLVFSFPADLHKSVLNYQFGHAVHKQTPPQGHPLPMSLPLLLALPLALASDYYCAEQIQRCAHEELESQVQFLKQQAFQSCIKRPACHQEKAAFDQCYKSSLRSMRSTFLATNESGTPFFDDTLESYRKELDQCFMHSPVVPMRSNFGPTILDGLSLILSFIGVEDSVYSRGLFGAELADRLWGLPEITVTRPSLDSMAVCRLRDPARTFGTGINNLLHSGDPKLNNISSSCLLEDSELICYRQQLDSNPEYVQAVYQRDYAIRECFQQLRVQTPCRLRDHSRLRSCVCGVRTKFDKTMEANILKCMAENSVANKVLIKAALHDFETDKITKDEAKPTKTLGMKTPSLIKGEMINGQCMCSCPTAGFSQHMTSLSSITPATQKKYGGVEEKKGGPRFRKNAPRMMHPGEAVLHINWGKRNN